MNKISNKSLMLMIFLLSSCTFFINKKKVSERELAKLKATQFEDSMMKESLICKFGQGQGYAVVRTKNAKKSGLILIDKFYYKKPFYILEFSDSLYYSSFQTINNAVLIGETEDIVTEFKKSNFIIIKYIRKNVEVKIDTIANPFIINNETRHVFFIYDSLNFFNQLNNPSNRLNFSRYNKHNEIIRTDSIVIRYIRNKIETLDTIFNPFKIE
jgi:hypothetical protein